MFAKRLLQKAIPPVHIVHSRPLTSADLDPRICYHYGIPYTASVLAFDPIQCLLAIGTLDGRIKIIGGDNIEGLLISTKKLPYKSLEFLQNEGYLVSISNENDIEVWDLERSCAACCLEWDANITASSIMQGTHFMYIGDEFGLMSVVKYDTEERKLLRLPYHTPANAIMEAAGISLPSNQSIVGILPQPRTDGNRVLIAYENGLIILWDISEARVILVRGYTDLQLKDDGIVGSPVRADSELGGHSSNYVEEEKVICSLCWASACGSILAVGYIDGDILLWNTSTGSSTKGQQAGTPSNDVVKLQLSSGERRLPVIVLHWSPDSRSNNDHGGTLFIYGGEEIGSEEVLTVLSLEWSSGIESLKCISRADLSLNGSFADMILIDTETMENNSTDYLFVLTNPGQLHVYDGPSLSKVTSAKVKNPSVLGEQFPVTVPIVDPSMTVAMLHLLSSDENPSKVLLEISSAMKSRGKPTLSIGAKWPVRGGVPSPLSFASDVVVKRLYIAGYRDGSVRIWDATFPVLSLVSVLEAEIPVIEVPGMTAPVSALDFCSISMSLAVGNECGLICIYRLFGSSNETKLHFVTAAKTEVHTVCHGKGFFCTAVVSILNVPIRTLHFTNSGARMVVGSECGQVAMVDLSSLSVMFLREYTSGFSSPIISIATKVLPHSGSIVNSPKLPELRTPQDPAEGLLLILTKDAHILVINSVTGNVTSSQPFHPKNEATAISMYVIDRSVSVFDISSEKKLPQLSQCIEIQKGPHSISPDACKPQEVELHCSDETVYSAESLSNTLVLLCCADALRLYSLKSVMQGDSKAIRKVNLVKPCFWSTTFKKKDDEGLGLVLLYQTGVLEIRSLPDLEVVGESSLMSILRWSFKPNMVKTMSSSGSEHIALVNGCELAFISLLAGENDFRIPDSLPCLHDKVLAAAADAVLSFYQKKKQRVIPGILGGIMKGFKGEKAIERLPKSVIIKQLEIIFSRVPFSVPSTTVADDQVVVDLDIDDIEIDESPPVASTSSHIRKHDRKDEEMEREKLLHGARSDTKPRVRTAEEIKAHYRKTGDASSAAAEAREKLIQRKEKLERISQRTEELQSGAESFAAMANELAKTMENRKWWKL